MKAAKAVSKSSENEKKHKSAARTRKWRERQSAERRSEIRQADLTGHAEGRTRLSEERRSEIRQAVLDFPKYKYSGRLSGDRKSLKAIPARIYLLVNRQIL